MDLYWQGASRWKISSRSFSTPWQFKPMGYRLHGKRHGWKKLWNIFCNYFLKIRPTEGVQLHPWAPVSGFWKIIRPVLIPAISEPSRSFLISVTVSELVSLPVGREKWCRTGTYIIGLRESWKYPNYVYCSVCGRETPQMASMSTKIPRIPSTSGSSPTCVKECDWEPITLIKMSTVLQEPPFQLWEQ